MTTEWFVSLLDKACPNSKISFKPAHATSAQSQSFLMENVELEDVEWWI